MGLPTYEGTSPLSIPSDRLRGTANCVVTSTGVWHRERGPDFISDDSGPGKPGVPNFGSSSSSSRPRRGD
eukprot:755368-Hanusia_phi.AAC.3